MARFSPTTVGAAPATSRLFSNEPHRPIVQAVPGVRLHALRHTHATVLLNKGVHLKIVQKSPRPTNMAIVLDTYSQVLPDKQSDMVTTTQADLSHSVAVKRSGCVTGAIHSSRALLDIGRRPAGFEPATGGLEVRQGRLSPDAAKCRKVA